jgi:hypothetical protein
MEKIMSEITDEAEKMARQDLKELDFTRERVKNPRTSAVK